MISITTVGDELREVQSCRSGVKNARMETLKPGNDQKTV